MARLTFGKLREAWRGEASDFTPLLAQQLDSIGQEIGVDLTPIGKAEVDVAGGRRIDVLASDADNTEFVIENQYGRGDHDHLTRGLAYAVARRARGLIIVAEEHRDEFRAVAQYLNDLAETSDPPGIAVWLVEARAVRIGDSAWAPLFATVVKPNQFHQQVADASELARPRTLAEFLALFSNDECRAAAEKVIERWDSLGRSRWYGSRYVTLIAPGPAKGGVRSVIALHPDGSVGVPFASYGGQNAGIPIPALMASDFRASTATRLGAPELEFRPRTEAGWLTMSRVEVLLEFGDAVAAAYEDALASVEVSAGLPLDSSVATNETGDTAPSAP